MQLGVPERSVREREAVPKQGAHPSVRTDVGRRRWQEAHRDSRLHEARQEEVDQQHEHPGKDNQLWERAKRGPLRNHLSVDAILALFGLVLGAAFPVRRAALKLRWHRRHRWQGHSSVGPALAVAAMTTAVVKQQVQRHALRKMARKRSSHLGESLLAVVARVGAVLPVGRRGDHKDGTAPHDNVEGDQLRLETFHQLEQTNFLF